MREHELKCWPEPFATWCPQCGPRVAVDEDGCCASCGADATGEGADRAIAAVAELERIRRELSRLSERLEDTFMGGYSDPRDLGIFRHGMGTAATCVEAVLRGERNQAPIVRPLPEGEPAPARPIEMALCESRHIIPRPGVLYRFTPVDGCPSCKQDVEPYQDAEGYVTTPEPTEQIAAAGKLRAIRHYGDINIIDDDIGAGIAWTKSTAQAKRICEALAAPAPGVVLSAEERAALTWCRNDLDGVEDALPVVHRAIDAIDRILAASPRPATLRVGSGMRFVVRQHEHPVLHHYTGEMRVTGIATDDDLRRLAAIDLAVLKLVGGMWTSGLEDGERQFLFNGKHVGAVRDLLRREFGIPSERTTP